MKINTDNNCYIKHHFTENFKESKISIRLDYASLYSGYKVINVTHFTEKIHEGKFSHVTSAELD